MTQSMTEPTKGMNLKRFFQRVFNFESPDPFVDEQGEFRLPSIVVNGEVLDTHGKRGLFKFRGFRVPTKDTSKDVRLSMEENTDILAKKKDLVGKDAHHGFYSQVSFEDDDGVEVADFDDLDNALSRMIKEANLPDLKYPGRAIAMAFENYTKNYNPFVDLTDGKKKKAYVESVEVTRAIEEEKQRILDEKNLFMRDTDILKALILEKMQDNTGDMLQIALSEHGYELTLVRDGKEIYRPDLFDDFQVLRQGISDLADGTYQSAEHIGTLMEIAKRVENVDVCLTKQPPLRQGEIGVYTLNFLFMKDSELMKEKVFNSFFSTEMKLEAEDVKGIKKLRAEDKKIREDKEFYSLMRMVDWALPLRYSPRNKDTPPPFEVMGIKGYTPWLPNMPTVRPNVLFRALMAAGFVPKTKGETLDREAFLDMKEIPPELTFHSKETGVSYTLQKILGSFLMSDYLKDTPAFDEDPEVSRAWFNDQMQKSEEYGKLLRENFAAVNNEMGHAELHGDHPRTVEISRRMEFEERWIMEMVAKFEHDKNERRAQRIPCMEPSAGALAALFASIVGEKMAPKVPGIEVRDGNGDFVYKQDTGYFPGLQSSEFQRPGELFPHKETTKPLKIISLVMGLRKLVQKPEKKMESGLSPSQEVGGISG